MNYKKQNFIDGQILKSDHLNYIEDGIKNIAEAIPTDEYINELIAQAIDSIEMAEEASF